LLSSCGANFSLTKRHYTGGYYFDFSKNKPEGIALKGDKECVQDKVKPLSNSTQKPP
jgi:hypothetical protein